jgi:DNA polymerase-3 subunit epsilon
MTWEDLKGKPKFSDVAAEFLDFVRDAEWIIHNAPFDIAFLDQELKRLDLPCCAKSCAKVIDTLAMARETFPGKRNSLDALCERFGIDNAHRTLHGALLDAQLLAEVYLSMTRGQETLTIDIAVASPIATLAAASSSPLRLALAIIAPSEDELAAHREYLAALEKESKGRCVWIALEASPEPVLHEPLPSAPLTPQAVAA